MGPDPITIAVRMSARFGSLSLPGGLAAERVTQPQTSAPQRISSTSLMTNFMEGAAPSRFGRIRALPRWTRILLVALPVAVLLGWVAHQPIGWNLMDWVMTPDHKSISYAGFCGE